MYAFCTKNVQNGTAYSVLV